MAPPVKKCRKVELPQCAGRLKTEPRLVGQPVEVSPGRVLPLAANNGDSQGLAPSLLPPAKKCKILSVPPLVGILKTEPKLAAPPLQGKTVEGGAIF